MSLRSGYPGLVFDPLGSDVRGFLFSSERLADHWARFDAFEGEGYERVVTTAKREDGTTVDAFVYLLNSSRG